MERSRLLSKDWQQVLLVMIVALLVYYPVFFSNYLYTDEAVQLWYYRPGEDYSMFFPQGRYLTDRLMNLLFGSITTIAEVKFLRGFSFAGWLLVIPLWFRILKRVFRIEGLPAQLVPLLLLFLVLSPTVTIAIGWASCLELFIAYTAGLASGYMAYLVIVRQPANFLQQLLQLLLSLIAGLVALFTYQNGIGCFLLPFLLHLLARPGNRSNVYKGIAWLFLICLVYYTLFRLQLAAYDMPEGERTDLGFGITQKIKFFFTKPLTSAFHFGYLITESSRAGVLVSMVLLAATGYLHFRWVLRQPSGIRQPGNSGLKEALIQLFMILLLLMLTYLPSMLVKENFASNRTMLALCLAVGSWVMVTISRTVKTLNARRITYLAVALLMLANAWYNYNFQFRKPLEKEYQLARETLESIDNWSATESYQILRPPEDLFVRTYDITRSWDEFGVPSNFFGWVPALVAKQVWMENGSQRSLLMSTRIPSYLLAELPGPLARQLGSLHVQHAGHTKPVLWTDPTDPSLHWILHAQ